MLHNAWETSSVGWPDTLDMGGLFSTVPDQNPWASASKVYVGYCSSDGASRRHAPRPGNTAAASRPPLRPPA